MRAFIFDPMWADLVTDPLLDRLGKAGLELTITTEIAPLRDCHTLLAGTDPRILCINPDYVDWSLTVADYRQIPGLVAILGGATSFSWIDTSHADAHDIAVCNIEGYSTQAVAEWATLVMFGLARKIPLLINNNFPFDGSRDFLRFRGVEIRGKLAGIIGFGDIGSAIASQCAALGMSVSYWSRRPRMNEYRYVQLERLVAEADVIFLALPSNAGTTSLLTPTLLATMKASAIFISVSHRLFDEEVALTMVREGNLFGLGLQAAPGTFSRNAGNVWAAPPYDWATDTAMHNAMSQWVGNMVLAARGEFPSRVNHPQIHGQGQWIMGALD